MKPKKSDQVADSSLSHDQMLDFTRGTAAPALGKRLAVQKRASLAYLLMTISLLLSLLLLFLGGLERRQASLADGLIRLHVLAHSDSPADQQLKEQVRDEVLLYTESLGEEAADVKALALLLEQNKAVLEARARAVVDEAGYDYAVSVHLDSVHFPTRTYDSFSLPAGYYEALQVVIGDGVGQNWWCVVFPPLCLAASSEELKTEGDEMGLTAEEVLLVLEEGPEYAFRFRAMELWDGVKQWANGD